LFGEAGVEHSTPPVVRTQIQNRLKLPLRQAGNRIRNGEEIVSMERLEELKQQWPALSQKAQALQ
jgi:hypothetical protein